MRPGHSLSWVLHWLRTAVPDIRAARVRREEIFCRGGPTTQPLLLVLRATFHVPLCVYMCRSLQLSHLCKPLGFVACVSSYNPNASAFNFQTARLQMPSASTPRPLIIQGHVMEGVATQEAICGRKRLPKSVASNLVPTPYLRDSRGRRMTLGSGGREGGGRWGGCNMNAHTRSKQDASGSKTSP